MGLVLKPETKRNETKLIEMTENMMFNYRGMIAVSFHSGFLAVSFYCLVSVV